MKAILDSNKFAGLTVLVVEDESLIFYLIEEMLSELGCRSIWRAADLQTALSLVEDQQPDVAVLDVNLAGEASYPVAVRLDEQAIPIVFSSGSDRTDIPESWKDRPFIQKPFTMTKFVAALDLALERRSADKNSNSAK